jgi:hypothetical protein
MMVSVLLRLRPSGLLDESPKLAAYVARGEARPAYKRAFAAQWAINAGYPASWLTKFCTGSPSSRDLAWRACRRATGLLPCGEMEQLVGGLWR